MSKTSKSTQTSTPANPAVTAAYGDLVGSAQSQAATPYTPYTGELVAPINATQSQATSGIASAANSAQPWLDEAAGYARSSATPITPQAYSPEAINQYMSPYTQNVVDATQNQFNLANAQQQSGLRGNAASAGALGGDREAILQAQLAGQQHNAQDPVIAQLYNTGFNNAQGEFNTQQGVNLNAAQANNASAANAGTMIGNLGLAGQNSALTGNKALLDAGTLAQTTAQAGDTAGYGSYQAAQAYPYQNLDFLSQILGQASAGSGTTTTGTQTKPFDWSTFLGSHADGGRVGMATGGVPPDVSVGYVPPAMQVPQGLARPPAMNMGVSGGNDTPSLKGLVDKGQGLMDAGKSVAAFFGLSSGGRPRLATGGTGEDYLGEVLSDIGADTPSAPSAAVPPTGATMLSAADTPSDWRGQATNFAPPAGGIPDAGVPPTPDPTWDDGTPVASGGADISGAAAPGPQKTVWEAPEPNVWHSALAGLGGLLTHGLGAGIQAGLKDYDDQLDPHPVVDHSGSTVMIQYGGPGRKGQIIDTGIPTEAALNSRAMADWRKANTDMNRDTRTAAIGERADASAAATAQRAAAAEEASRDRANALEVARINASAGRYTPIPGKGVDANGKPVDGVYMTNGKTGEMEFRPGIVLTNKQGNFRSLPAMVAATWQQEHPNASAEDAENFAAAYSARIAGATNAGRGAAATAVNEGTVNNSIGILRKLIPFAASTGPVTSLNNLFQSVSRHTNDANAINFKNAIDSITAEYARVLTGATSGAPSSDAARKAAEERILTGYNANALPAVLDQMQAEMRGRSASYANVLGQHTGGTYSGPTVPHGVDEGSSPAGASFPLVTSQQQFDALQSGAIYLSRDGKKHRKP